MKDQRREVDPPEFWWSNGMASFLANRGKEFEQYIRGNDINEIGRGVEERQRGYQGRDEPDDDTDLDRPATLEQVPNPGCENP